MSTDQQKSPHFQRSYYPLGHDHQIKRHEGDLSDLYCKQESCR